MGTIINLTDPVTGWTHDYAEPSYPSFIDFLNSYSHLNPKTFDNRPITSYNNEFGSSNRLFDSGKGEITYTTANPAEMISKLDNGEPVHVVVDIKNKPKPKKLFSLATVVNTLSSIKNHFSSYEDIEEIGFNIVGYDRDFNTDELVFFARDPINDNERLGGEATKDLYINHVSTLTDRTKREQLRAEGILLLRGDYFEKNSSQAMYVNEKTSFSVQDSVIEFLEKNYAHLSSSEVMKSIDSLKLVRTSTGLGHFNHVSSKTVTGANYTLDVHTQDGLETVFAKSTTSESSALEKEAICLTDAWNAHEIMTVITPKLVDLTKSGNVTTLFTYSTKHKKYTDSALQAYVNLKKQILTNYSQKNNVLLQMNESEDATDMINLAISHSFMKQYKDKSVYKTGHRPTIQKSDVLNDRIGHSCVSADVKNFLFSEMILYNYISEDVSEHSVVEDHLLHFDPRKANTFEDSFGWIRPKGDPAAQIGSVQQDIGRAEVRNLHKMVNLYAVARETVEQTILGNNFEYTSEEKEKITTDANKIGYLQSVRMASTYAARGLDVTQYIELIQHYKSKLPINLQKLAA